MAEGEPASPGDVRESIVTMAVESWRFSKVYDRLLGKLDAGERGRYESQYRWFLKKIEESLHQAGLRLVSLEGQRFDSGMAATPLNIDEFDASDTLVIDQMLEPVIMSDQGLVKTGTVILRKIEQ
jgi:hypothetical protein